VGTSSIRANPIRSGQAPASARLLTLIGIVVVIVGLYFGRQVLIPLALAAVLAFLLSPVVSFLEKCRLPRVPAVLVVLVLVFALIGFLGWTVSGQLMIIVDQFPSYKSNIHDKIQSFRVPNGTRLRDATNTVTELSNELSAASESAVDKKTTKTSASHPIAVQVAQPPSNAPQYLRAIVGPLTGVFETSGMVIVFALFMLVKREDLRNRVIRLAGQGRLTVVTQALDDGSRRLSRYLLFQFLVNAVYGAIFGGVVYWIGVPHALLWGVLSGLLRFVPYVGSPIATAFPITMALAVFPGWHEASLVFGLFVVLELITTNVIEPWLYGSHTGISSLAILVAAVFWATLWGPIGLILSTPLTVGLILMGRYVPQLNFLEILLGDEPVLPVEAHFYQRLLALDQEEASAIAEAYLKQNPIGRFYDSVLIPALALSEQDRHVNSLEATTANFVSQSTRELIEELGDRSFGDRSLGDRASDDRSFDEKALFDQLDQSKGESESDEMRLSGRLSGLRVICVPAGDEADELVGLMLAQLLKRLGCDIRCLQVVPVEAAKDFNRVSVELTTNAPEVVVISALPPFASAQARSLCKQLRKSHPKLKIILGLWSFEGGVEKAKERVGPGCADLVAINLQQAIALLGQATSTDEPKKSNSALDGLDQEIVAAEI
jgi:predicted PurR-regulated permease PerM